MDGNRQARAVAAAALLAGTFLSSCGLKIAGLPSSANTPGLSVRGEQAANSTIVTVDGEETTLPPPKVCDRDDGTGDISVAAGSKGGNGFVAIVIGAGESPAVKDVILDDIGGNNLSLHFASLPGFGNASADKTGDVYTISGAAQWRTMPDSSPTTGLKAFTVKFTCH